MALVLMKRGTNPCSTRWLQISSDPFSGQGQSSKKPFSLSQPTAIFLLIAVAATGGLRILFIFTSFTRFPLLESLELLTVLGFKLFLLTTLLRLPLGDSTTILFSSPVLVITLSVFLLDERCGVFRFAAACSLVLGVVLIAKPPLIFGHNKEVDGRYTAGKCQTYRLSMMCLVTHWFSLPPPCPPSASCSPSCSPIRSTMMVWQNLVETEFNSLSGGEGSDSFLPWSSCGHLRHRRIGEQFWSDDEKHNLLVIETEQ